MLVVRGVRVSNAMHAASQCGFDCSDLVSSIAKCGLNVLIAHVFLAHLRIIHHVRTLCTLKQVLGRIVGMADAAQDPADFPTSPALAAPKALAAAGLPQSAVDYWEVNEAFCVVDMVNRRLLQLDPARHGPHVPLQQPRLLPGGE